MMAVEAVAAITVSVLGRFLLFYNCGIILELNSRNHLSFHRTIHTMKRGGQDC